MTGDIRALSIRQPWAALIAEGLKTIELRTWFTHYRGPLAIVAARDVDRAGVAMHGRQREPRMHIVALATLADIRPARPSDARRAMVSAIAPDTYAWVLEDVRAVVAPIPCSGRQGLFTVTLPKLR